MCKVHSNKLFGGTPVDDLLMDAGKDLNDAYSKIQNIGKNDSDYVRDANGNKTDQIKQEVVLKAQNELTQAKQMFDLFQEMKKMINQIYDTIIRNINPR